MPRTAVEGESFTALQLRTLEAEMAHLRATIDVLLETKGIDPSHKLPSVLTRGGSSSASPVSSLRVGEASLSAAPAAAGITERTAQALALHAENMALPSVAATLEEKHRHDARLEALKRESTILRDPSTVAAATESHYARDSLEALVEPTPPSAAPLVLPAPVPASASSPMPGGRRASLHSRRSSVAGPLLESTASAMLSAPLTGGGGSSAPTPASARRGRSAGGSAPAGTVHLLSSPSAAARQTAGSSSSFPSSSSSSSTLPPPRSPPGAASPAPLSPSRRPSKKELEGMYAGLPGSSKRVASTTKGRSFSFTTKAEPKLGIRERKVQADLEAKAAEEASHLTYVFRAQPIAPATADIGLFQSIMDKQAARREREHAAKAAYAAAHFRPFDIVNAHCEEAAARAAARAAKEELEVQRELRECAKFKANRLSDAIKVRPPGLVQVTQVRKKRVREVRLAKAREVFVDEPVRVWMPTREVGREGRIEAEARASAARASLPPRMALAVEELSRKQTERAARAAEEEARERAEHAFHPSPLPNFGEKQARFRAACDAARVAVTSQWQASASAAFSFDTAAAKAGEAARKDRWVKEFELSTSRALPLRRLTRAYAEGQDLVGDRQHMQQRPHSAGPRPGLKGTLGVNPLFEATAAMSAGAARGRRGSVHGGGGGRPASADAPPASMTRSVMLKMAAVQAKLRGAQEAEYERERADEAYRSTDRACSARLGSTFAAMERERLTVYDGGGNAVGQRELSWHMDSVTASASESARYFREESAKRARALKATVARAQSDRPLVMMKATLERAKDKARVQALARTARAAALGGLGTGGGSEENGMFDEEERALVATSEELLGGGGGSA